MNTKGFNRRLFRFIGSSPTPFHAVQNITNCFEKSGFLQLRQTEKWRLKHGNGYYLVCDDGSVIGFYLGKTAKITDGFRILAAHTDSPCLKIKPKPLDFADSYMKLGVEVYGSPLLHTWFDRELGIAGRVRCESSDNECKTLLVELEETATIPSLAIHFNREANKNSSVDAQKDLPLLFSQSSQNKKTDFNRILLRLVRNQYPKRKWKKLLSHDLFCFDCNSASYFGESRRFIRGPRLDNLVSCFIGMTAMSKNRSNSNSLFICSNHEEVGSVSMSGARGSFLSSCFERIIPDNDERHRTLAASFMISMYNAHALHPNAGEASDGNHPVLLNGGPVIKYNGNQRYTSNSLSSSIYKEIGAEAGVNLQEFVMKSDLSCGSTIGPMVSADLGVQSVDVGVPSLGMHSIQETIGADDSFLLYKTIVQFLNRKSFPLQEG